MQTVTTYIGTLNDVEGVWTGSYPTGAVITEERTVLFPDDGYVLSKNGETYSYVWLENGDTASNYTEIVPTPEPVDTGVPLVGTDTYSTLITLAGVLNGLPQNEEMDDVAAATLILANI